MRKSILFLSLAMLTAFTSQAQRHKNFDELTHMRPAEKMATAAKSNPNYKMECIYTDDNYERMVFFFNNQNRLIAVEDAVMDEYDMSNSYKVTDSCHYNGNGDLVKLAGWQYFLNTGITKNVYYVEYTYDNNHNVTSRTNYNNINGEWALGGVYNYTYNSNNQITLTTLTMMDVIFQKIEYIYQNGNLYREIWYNYDFSGDRLYPYETLTYSYNDNNQVVEVIDSVYDEYGSYEWVYEGQETYAYNGNDLTEYHKYNSNGREIKRRVFDYGDMLQSDVLMPWHPDIDRPDLYTNNTHAYTREAYWALDADYRLQYICDYVYSYIPINMQGINQAEVASINIYPNPTTGIIRLSGIDKPTKAMLFDNIGRVVMKLTIDADSQIDLSKLARGTYSLRTADGRSAQIILGK